MWEEMRAKGRTVVWLLFDETIEEVKGSFYTVEQQRYKGG